MVTWTSWTSSSTLSHLIWPPQWRACSTWPDCTGTSRCGNGFSVAALSLRDTRSLNFSSRLRRVHLKIRSPCSPQNFLRPPLPADLGRMLLAALEKGLPTPFIREILRRGAPLSSDLTTAAGRGGSVEAFQFLVSWGCPIQLESALFEAVSCARYRFANFLLCRYGSGGQLPASFCDRLIERSPNASIPWLLFLITSSTWSRVTASHSRFKKELNRSCSLRFAHSGWLEFAHSQSSSHSLSHGISQRRRPAFERSSRVTSTPI